MAEEKKPSKRSGFKLGMSKADIFQSWEVGTNYKCEKLLGQGSYG